MSHHKQHYLFQSSPGGFFNENLCIGDMFEGRQEMFANIQCKILYCFNLPKIKYNIILISVLNNNMYRVIMPFTTGLSYSFKLGQSVHCVFDGVCWNDVRVVSLKVVFARIQC